VGPRDSPGVLGKKIFSLPPEILTADRPALKGVEPHWEGGRVVSHRDTNNR